MSRLNSCERSPMPRDPVLAYGDALFEAISSATVIESEGWAAERVARASERLNEAAGTSYRAVLVWSSQATAFSFPGQDIYISRELLSRGLSEEGVAFVIAHEIAHHLLGHFSALTGALSTGDALHEVQALFHQLFKLVSVSAEDELKADALAIDLCLAAGYSGEGAIETFLLLSRVALDYRAIDHVFDKGERDAGLLHQLFGHANTHPPLHLRRSAALKRLEGGEEGNSVDAESWLPSALSSTSLVCACASCALRFAPRSLCPGCGTSTFEDLRSAQERKVFVRKLYARAFRGPSSRARSAFVRVVARGGVIGVGGALVGAAGLALGAPALSAIALFAVGIGLCLELMRVVASDGQVSLRGSARVLMAGTHLTIISGRPRETNAQDSVTGRVHIKRPIRSPLSGTLCAAYRIAGEGPSGQLDEAGIGEFEVHPSGPGAQGLVSAPDALLHLPVGPGTQTPMTPELTTWLRSRSLLPTNSPFELSETLILEGDHIRVSGAVQNRQGESGIRGTREIKAFYSWPIIEGRGRRDEGSESGER